MAKRDNDYLSDYMNDEKEFWIKAKEAEGLFSAGLLWGLLIGAVAGACTVIAYIYLLPLSVSS